MYATTCKNAIRWRRLAEAPCDGAVPARRPRIPVKDRPLHDSERRTTRKVARGCDSCEVHLNRAGGSSTDRPGRSEAVNPEELDAHLQDVQLAAGDVELLDTAWVACGSVSSSALSPVKI